MIESQGPRKLKTVAVISHVMECPDCGAPVTMEVGPEHPLTASLVDALIAADEDEQIKISRNCWECGWREERLIRVESVETIDGDEPVAKRASLLNEIRSEAEAIESIAMLEDALAEVRRQRRLEPDASDAATDTTPDG